MRWWDGNQWTAHLQQPAPAAPSAPVAPVAQVPVAFAPIEPQISLSAYSPVTGFAGQSRDAAAHDPYASRYSPAPVPHNNFIAWFALVAGVLAISAIFIRIAIPSGSYYLPVFGLTATIAGIRGIYRFHRGRVTVLWAPIVGLVLGAVAEIILIASIILSATLAATPAAATVLGPSGQSVNNVIGTSKPTYLPTANPTLSEAAVDEANVVAILDVDYGTDASGTQASDPWPTALTHDAEGHVFTSDGRDLGQLIPAGWHLAYQVESNGSFALYVSGPNTTEVAVYTSANDEYLAWCATSDTSCTTKSPAPSFPGPGASGTTTTTTT